MAEAGHSALFVETDIASAGSCAALAEQTVDRFGGIDFLINNASIFGGKRKEGLLTVEYAYYQRFMEVNMNGQLLATRAVYPSMVERGGGGAIVNQSSIAAWTGGDFYSVSKAATNAMTVSPSARDGPL